MNSNADCTIDKNLLDTAKATRQHDVIDWTFRVAEQALSNGGNVAVQEKGGPRVVRIAEIINTAERLAEMKQEYVEQSMIPCTPALDE